MGKDGTLQLAPSVLIRSVGLLELEARLGVSTSKHLTIAHVHAILGLWLASGAWALVYNDTTSGRRSLAVSLSFDEGRTWPKTRHLENQTLGQFHYPAITQGKDGTLHVVFSYFVEQGKSMKRAAFNEAWIKAGDEK